MWLSTRLRLATKDRRPTKKASETQNARASLLRKAYLGVVLFLFLTAGAGAGAGAEASAASSPESPCPDMDLFIANRNDMFGGVGLEQQADEYRSPHSRSDSCSFFSQGRTVALALNSTNERRGREEATSRTHRQSSVTGWVQPPGVTDVGGESARRGRRMDPNFRRRGLAAYQGCEPPFPAKNASRFLFFSHPSSAAPPTREAPPDSSDLGTSTLARGVVRIILIPGKQQARREGTHGVGASGGRGTGQFAKTIAEAAVRQQEREKGSAWLRP